MLSRASLSHAARGLRRRTLFHRRRRLRGKRASTVRRYLASLPSPVFSDFAEDSMDVVYDSAFACSS